MEEGARLSGPAERVSMTPAPNRGCSPRLCSAAAKSVGGSAGYRSPCLSHAKRALYHLSYTPAAGDVRV